MTPKQFARYLERDGGCYHCGDVETAIPQHRVNRGMGGSKKRDHPANIIVLCSLVNGLIESNAEWATKARTFGWKLSPWDDPAWVPVFDAVENKWWLLDDGFDRDPLIVLERAEDRPF